MKLYISPHAQMRVGQRCSFDKLLSSLYKLFFCGEGVEMIENKKNFDFTGLKQPENHKVLVNGEVLVLNENCTALLTLNPCSRSKLKRRRTQNFRKHIGGKK